MDVSRCGRRGRFGWAGAGLAVSASLLLAVVAPAEGKAPAHRSAVVNSAARTTVRAVQPPTVFGLSANGEQAVRDAEKVLARKAGVLGVFTDFTQRFPAQEALNAAARGAALMISWEPQAMGMGQNQPQYGLDRITAGDFDPYIRRFARDAAATGRPVFIRFAAEMNGDWQVWSKGVNGNGAGDYRRAYRHVVDVARRAGGTNIKWMFNPIVSYPGSEPLSRLYPGDRYVDWVALDGYNWGSTRPWGWQSFTDVFAAGFTELRTVAPSKPLAIAEIGCAPGEGKAEWVRDALVRAREAGVQILVWFEHNKETDWRLTADPAVAEAAKQVLAQPGWVAGGSYSAVRRALRVSRRAGPSRWVPRPAESATRWRG